VNNKRKTKILFVHCPSPLYTKNQDFGIKYMPTWAFVLITSLKKTLEIDWDYRIFDSRFDKVEDFKDFDIILFSGINQDYDELKLYQKELRRLSPESVTMVGGPIAWSFEKSEDLHLLDFFDHIFIGDGEDYIAPIIRLLDAKIKNMDIGQVLVGNSSEDLLSLFALRNPLPKIIKNPRRFDISKSLPAIDSGFVPHLKRYYGGIVEVSRGCPFLCEFCDIRTMLDNNKSHNRDVETIITELEFMRVNGVNQVILACDNLIGDHAWAERLVDAILAWKAKKPNNITFYTWLTLTLTNYPILMQKMRKAGFDLIFIGVESFNKNSLLETAKLQNTKGVAVEDHLKTIQSYGFIVVAGLIIGFDSDNEDVFEITSKGMVKSGLLTGDPSLLYALPGTPLYMRMKLANRLLKLDGTSESRQKISSNMLYLLPKKTLVDGWISFSKTINSPEFNRKRYVNYIKNIKANSNYIPTVGSGFGSIKTFLSNLLLDADGRNLLIKRVMVIFKSIKNIKTLVTVLLYTYTQRKVIPGVFNYFKFWVYAWSNSLIRYRDIKPTDFNINSLERGYKIEDVIPTDYENIIYEEDIPESKVRAQRRSTIKTLKKLFENKNESEGPEGPSLR